MLLRGGGLGEGALNDGSRPQGESRVGRWLGEMVAENESDCRVGQGFGGRWLGEMVAEVESRLQGRSGFRRAVVGENGSGS